MKTFNNIISSALRFILIFLLYFIWLRYYMQSLVWCIVLTFVLTFTSDLLLRLILKKRNVKASLKKEELLRAEGYCNAFVFNNKSYSVNFFNDLLALKFKTTKKTDFIVFEKDSEKNILYPFYQYTDVTIENVIQVFNKVQSINPKTVFLCVNSVDEKARGVASKLPTQILILDKYETYEKIMKNNNFYPDTLFNFNPTPKFTFYKFLEISLNRRRASGYIFASITLLLASLFVRVTVYYLIISSILLILAIFSYTNTIFNKKLPKDLF